MSNFNEADHPRGLPNSGAPGSTRGSFTEKANTSPETGLPAPKLPFASYPGPVGYTYKADLYEPAQLIEAMIRSGDASPAAREMDVEDVLDQIASANGIDREDEYSFDSDDFPKPVFRHQLDPEEQSQPETDLGPLLSAEGLYFQEVQPDGTQLWGSGGSENHWTAEVHPDGSSEFFLAGDLHRGGGPARILADGTEQWFRYGTPVRSPFPDPSTEFATHNADGEPITVTSGSKFDPRRTPTEIRRALSLDLIHAKRCEVIPEETQVELRTSGRTRSVQIRLLGFVGDAQEDDQHYREEIRQLREKLTLIGGAYQQVITNQNTNAVESNYTVEVIVAYQPRRLGHEF